MNLTYRAIVTKVEIAGADAAISAVVPHPTNDKDLLMNIATLVPREEGLNIKITDQIDVTINSVDPKELPADPATPEVAPPKATKAK